MHHPPGNGVQASYNNGSLITGKKSNSTQNSESIGDDKMQFPPGIALGNNNGGNGGNGMGTMSNNQHTMSNQHSNVSVHGSNEQGNNIITAAAMGAGGNANSDRISSFGNRSICQ